MAKLLIPSYVVLMDAQVLSHHDQILGNPNLETIQLSAQQSNQPIQQPHQPMQPIDPNQSTTAQSSLTPAQNQGIKPQSPPLSHDTYRAPDGTLILDIKAINKYSQSYVIKVKVATRSEKKTWENTRGSGVLFSCELVDKSGEIRATAFNESVEKFYDLLEPGKMFFISKAQIRTVLPERKRFSSVDNNFELMLSSSTTVTPCPDDPATPNFRVNPVSLVNIPAIPAESIIDVVGVVTDASDLNSITSRKDGRQIPKRTVIIGDDTKSTIELTLWGDQATNFSVPFNDPLDPDTKRVSKWWSSAPAEAQLASLSPLTSRMSGDGSLVSADVSSIQQGRDAHVGKGETPTFFTCGFILPSPDFQCRATVMQIKHDDAAPLYYPACPTAGCNKKVIQGDGNLWYCPKCNLNYDRFDPRYVLNLLVSDYSGGQWVMMFDNEAKKLLKADAQVIKNLRDQGDPELHNRFEEALYTQLDMKLKMTEEIYNDEPRLHCTVTSSRELDYAQESRVLLNKINNMLQ